MRLEDFDRIYETRASHVRSELITTPSKLNDNSLDVAAVNIDHWYVINTQLLTEIYKHFLSFACIYNHSVYVLTRDKNSRFSTSVSLHFGNDTRKQTHHVVTMELAED